MMQTTKEAILAVDSLLAASIVAKATVILAMALLGAWLARGSRASVRHGILAAAFGVLLWLPIVAVVAPPVRIAVAAADQKPATPPVEAGAALVIPHAAPLFGSASEIPRESALSPTALLLTGWIFGAALFLLPMAVGWRQVRSLRRSALPWPHGQSVAERLALDAGVRRRVEVLLHDALTGPTTCGAVHPAIVFPRDAQSWDAEDLHRALVHELEHVRRGDWATHCLVRVVCAAYWFHPLVWIAWRRSALEAERACDDAVLARSEATAYADQLVGLAQRLCASRKSPALAMASSADLSARVGALLDSRQRRGRAGALPVALTWAAAVTLVLAISPLRMVAAPQGAGAQTALPETPAPPVVLAQAGAPQAVPPRVAAPPTASARPATAVQTSLRFLAQSTLVIVDATVKDQNGKPIEGLKADDFVLTEEGTPQAIWLFEFQRLDAAPAQGNLPGVSSYYILGYYTTNSKADGQYRKIQVALRNPATYKVDYRAGYYARVSGSAGIGGAGPGDVGTGIGPGMTPPLLITKVDPEYSEQARKAKYSGTVILSVEVNAGGRVSDARVVKSLGMGLDEKAIEAVLRWRFKPGMKDGAPVAMSVEVEVSFRLL